MLRKSLFVTTVLTALTAIHVAAQANLCPAIVETALAELDSTCQGVNRNQACYGHINIEALAQADISDFNFSQVGDVVDLNKLHSLRLSPLDTTAGVWGVALMRVQANLPDTLPGQNVTMLIFGDTEVINYGTIGEMIPLSTRTRDGSNVNIRVAPTTGSLVVRSIPNGSLLTSIGRTEDFEWIMVRIADTGEQGWVYRELLEITGSLELLPIIEAETPQYGPMQAIYLNTNRGLPSCNDLPENGVLVQTPDGAGPVHMAINGVDVTFGSTLYFQASAEGGLNVTVVEGGALVSSNGVSRAVPQGGFVSVPLNTDLQATGEPSRYSAYDENRMRALPVNVMERDITVAPATSIEVINAITRFEAIFQELSVKQYPLLYGFLLENPQARRAEVYRFLEDHAIFVRPIRSNSGGAAASSGGAAPEQSSGGNNNGGRNRPRNNGNNGNGNGHNHHDDHDHDRDDDDDD